VKGISTKCEQCGKPFMAKNRSGRFCTRKCVHRHDYLTLSAEKIARYRRQAKEWSKANRARRRKTNKEWRVKAGKRHLEVSRKWHRNNRLANKAHIAVKSAIQKGKLIRPNACSECAKACKPQGHHEDYSKPLEVIWLCVTCHKKREKRPSLQTN
jgi:hypothetical protein